MLNSNGMSGLSLRVMSERVVSSRNSVLTPPSSTPASGSGSIERRSKRLDGLRTVPRPCRPGGRPGDMRPSIPHVSLFVLLRLELAYGTAVQVEQTDDAVTCTEPPSGR